jgi:N-acetylmuramoyl-L-alanine amidase
MATMSRLVQIARQQHLRSLSGTLAVLLALSATNTVAASSRVPSGRPDRQMYFAAKAAQLRVEKPSRHPAGRTDWEKVAQQYVALVARYPQSAYCDDALLRTGDLYRAMGERFRGQRDLTEAVRRYNQLVSQYPSSSLAEQALFSAFEIEHTRRGRRRANVGDAARRYIKNFPDGPHASVVRMALRTTVSTSPSPTSSPSPSVPEPPPPGLARVFDLRTYTSASTTRVVIFLEKRVNYQQGRVENPDRLFIDLLGTHLHPNLESRKFPVGDGLLQQVRVAQFNPQVVRIVLDFKDIAEETVFCLDNPVRLIVDVQAPARSARTAANNSLAAKATRLPAPLLPARITDPPVLPASETDPATPTPRAERPATVAALPATETHNANPDPSPEVRLDAKAEKKRREKEQKEQKERERDKRNGQKRPAPPAAPVEPPSSSTPSPESDSPPDRVDARIATPTPQPNRSGSYSLVRQLGLGARRIVIDPGHGGHDPGTIGRGGLQEKDLVLDVALRLERLIRQRLGLDVVMTRRSDVFIPLEERTAIANAKDADLFLSIHVNSSRTPRAAGVETYYLSFAVDSHAEEVAARENAISPATLKDLSGLVRAIMQNSKIEESRDFATDVQTAMISTLRPSNRVIEDRGVRRAPFYVLLGANMPSILAEIAFVSHREEERLLRSSSYRDSVAQGLLRGVQGYLDDLHAGRGVPMASEFMPDRPAGRRAAQR